MTGRRDLPGDAVARGRRRPWPGRSRAGADGRPRPAARGGRL